MGSIIEGMKVLLWCWMALHISFLPAYAEEKMPSGDSNAQVMEAFNQANQERGTHEISDKRKQQIMFLMGITLLVFIITRTRLWGDAVPIAPTGGL